MKYHKPTLKKVDTLINQMLIRWTEEDEPYVHEDIEDLRVKINKLGGEE